MTKSLLRKSTIAVLATSAIVVITPVTLSADDVWEREVRVQLRQVAAAVDDYADYVPSHDPFLGWLQNNTYSEIEYNLQAGVRYLFVGVCDNDCSDLDLKLYDGYHNFVTQDNGDDKPMLTVKVATSGRFYLRVIMARCHAGTCRYGTQAFRPAN